MATGGGPADDEAAMKARLNALNRDLAGYGAKQDSEAARPPTGMGSAMNLGFRVMSEFVAAVGVAGFIGWQLDRWLGTSPGFLILFVMLGTAAGFWSVYRVATRAGSK